MNRNTCGGQQFVLDVWEKHKSCNLGVLGKNPSKRKARVLSRVQGTTLGSPWGDRGGRAVLGAPGGCCKGGVGTALLWRRGTEWWHCLTWEHGMDLLLPKTRAGHLNHPDRGGGALGCRVCAPQSSAAPWLVQWERPGPSCSLYWVTLWFIF